MDFPNGIDGIISGDRGRKFGELWKVKIFKVKLDPKLRIVEAEVGYRGHFWIVNRFGKVYRVNHGKTLTLCDMATLSPANESAFKKMVKEWLYGTSN